MIVAERTSRMTINNDCVILWDNGYERFEMTAVSPESQYRYIDGEPCITVGFRYENESFKGYDYFTFLGKPYTELIDKIKEVHRTLNGSFRLYDMGADTDAYVDFSCLEGRAEIVGRLGATFSDFALAFSMTADQTLLTGLLDQLKL